MRKEGGGVVQEGKITERGNQIGEERGEIYQKNYKLLEKAEFQEEQNMSIMLIFCSGEEVFMKILSFLSFHTNQMTAAILMSHSFSMFREILLLLHMVSSALKSGGTIGNLYLLQRFVQIDLVNLQVKSKCVKVSSISKHKGQLKGAAMFLLARTSEVNSAPLVANQRLIFTLRGALVDHSVLDVLSLCKPSLKC